MFPSITITFFIISGQQIVMSSTPNIKLSVYQYRLVTKIHFIYIVCFRLSSAPEFHPVGWNHGVPSTFSEQIVIHVI